MSLSSVSLTVGKLYLMTTGSIPTVHFAFVLFLMFLNLNSLYSFLRKYSKLVRIRELVLAILLRMLSARVNLV